MRLRDFLKRVGADTRAKYVWFQCAEGYSNTIDMPTALHPQTQLTFKFDDQILPRKYGFPMKIRIPTKLGFKNPKHVIAHVRAPTTIPAATGKTRATTGSAGFNHTGATQTHDERRRAPRQPRVIGTCVHRRDFR